MIVLVLGGARSGKSAVGERIAGAAGGSVTYVATASPTDPDMAARIAVHRARRPSTWETLEAGSDLAALVRAVEGTILVDALGPWVARTEGCEVDADELCDALAARAGTTVVVSEEVGLGVHPSSEAGRRFRDVLGLLNQKVAAVADHVLLVVAGRALRLERVEEVLGLAPAGELVPVAGDVAVPFAVGGGTA